MKSSLFLAATGAALALATPLEKRKYETKVVVEYQTVTVTDGAEPTKSVYANNGGKYRQHHHSSPPVVVVTKTFPVAEPTYQAPPPKPTKTEEASPPTYPTATQKESAPAAPSDFISQALYSHNIHRANNSAPALSWNQEIAGYAANTAATCKFAHDMDQGNGHYGQNIAMWGTSSNAASLGEAGAISMAADDMWYNGEIGKYPSSSYGQDSPDMSDFEAWGHYSQLIWKGTEGLGCSAQLCKAGTMFPDMDAWYMVCNYRPAGNVGGAYGENVLPPLGKATITANKSTKK